MIQLKVQGDSVTEFEGIANRLRDSGGRKVTREVVK